MSEDEKILISKQKKGNKTYIRELKMTDSLPSQIAELEYPVDALKEIYIKSGRTLERIAKLYGISSKQLSEYVKAGNWDKLRTQHETKLMNSVLRMRNESFLNNLNTDQREQQLKDFQRNRELDEVEEHFEKYGHLFCVDPETGDILRDRISGLPMKLNFGSGKEQILTRREMQASVELNLKLLDESSKDMEYAKSQELKKLENSIDIDSYGIFSKDEK